MKEHEDSLQFLMFCPAESMVIWYSSRIPFTNSGASHTIFAVLLVLFGLSKGGPCTSIFLGLDGTTNRGKKANYVISWIRVFVPLRYMHIYFWKSMDETEYFHNKRHVFDWLRLHFRQKFMYFWPKQLKPLKYISCPVKIFVLSSYLFYICQQKFCSFISLFS